MTEPRGLTATPAGRDRPDPRRDSRSCTRKVTFQVLPHDVHVWCAFCDEIRDEALLGEYERLLSADERERRSRFVFPHDRHRFLVTRALVRTVLSTYADVAPADWTFVVNTYGRPEIAPRHPGAGMLSFSVSHTPGLVVLGVGHGRALGVDTEHVRGRQAPEGVAERYFAPAEAAALRAVPEAHQPRRFFEYWTLKEAYVKARSLGLSLPLRDFAVRFIGERGVALSVDGEVAVSPWHLWQFSVAEDYLVAVCAGRTGPGQVRLLLKKVVPLRGEEDLDARELRTSA
jgi:4'-phosphopantetheinyl transferase